MSEKQEPEVGRRYVVTGEFEDCSAGNRLTVLEVAETGDEFWCHVRTGSGKTTKTYGIADIRAGVSRGLLLKEDN